MPLAFVEKRRHGNKGQSQVMTLIGDVKGKDVIIIDDECDTSGSMVNAANTVRDYGARDVYLAFTHAVLSGCAAESLAAIGVKEIVTTNTVPIPPEKRLPNMKILSIAPLIAEVIMRTHEGRSVGQLFNE
jgi:ribose-phosphate pyrophosphokinase